MLKQVLKVISNAFCKKLTIPNCSTQETEEYFQEETSGGKGSGMANGSAIHDVTDAGGGARVITSENMMMSSSEHNASSAVKGSDTSIIVDSKSLLLRARVFLHLRCVRQ